MEVLVPVLIAGVIAIALLVLLHRLTRAKSRQINVETDEMAMNGMQIRVFRENEMNDREPNRMRNRDMPELVYTFVLGLTHDERRARGEAAYAEHVIRNGGSVDFGLNEVNYEISHNSSLTRQFSERQ